MTTKPTKTQKEEAPSIDVASTAPAKATAKGLPAVRLLKMADELANFAVHVPTHGVSDSFVIGARLRDMSIELRALAEEV